MVDDPYRAPTAGVLEHDVDLGGRLGRVRYQLDGAELRAEPVDGKTPPRAIALANVVHVQLAAFGGTTICTLRARDGKTLAFSSGEAPTPPDPPRARAFATMLEALNERIAAASPDAKFVTGSWAIGGAFVAMTLLCGGAVAWLAQDAVMRGLLKFKVACGVLAALALVATPIAFVRGRPKPYDPRKLPRAYDPVAPR